MSNNDLRNRGWSLLAGAVATVMGVAVAAAASPSAARAQDCFPPCRSGYTCQAGACVSSCDPPCAPGHTCNSMGACEPPAGTVPPPGGGGAAPPPGGGGVAPPPGGGGGLTPPGGGGGAPLWGPGAQPPGGAPQRPPPAGGAPAWGPGSATAGQQVWSPETAPPTPLTDEEIERLAIRTRGRFVIYGLVGAFEEDWDDTLDTSEDWSFGGGFGLGFRYNFTRAFGVQARVLTTFDTAEMTVESGWGEDAQWDEETMGLDVVLDAGIRLGPVSDEVPWYFGFIFGVGGHFLMGDALCITTDPDRWDCDDPHAEGTSYRDGEVVDLATSLVGFSGGVETGFIFGGSEQFDLAFRVVNISDFDGAFHLGLTLVFGLALL